MRILLVRHGESQANVDQSLHRLIPDHEISLSSRGFDQAKHAGEILKAFFDKEYSEFFSSNISEEEKMQLAFRRAAKENGFDESSLSDMFDSMAGLAKKFNIGNLINKNEDLKPKIRLWNSPYRRTRETAKIVKETLGNYLFDCKEDVLLCEQQFGLFDGLEDDEQAKKFPNEDETFQHLKKYNGKFWARYPMGESPFDVAIRLRLFFETLKKDQDNGINDAVVVCHGNVIKLFVLAWLNKSPEWFVDQRTAGNCGIVLLDNDKESQYIFGGYKLGKAWEPQHVSEI